MVCMTISGIESGSVHDAPLNATAMQQSVATGGPQASPGRKP